MKRIILASENDNKLIGSNGQYAYKGFTIARSGHIWEIRVQHSNDVVRECSSLKECIDRIDTQTV